LSSTVEVRPKEIGAVQKISMERQGREGLCKKVVGEQRLDMSK